METIQRSTDRQLDRHTDGQIDRQTDTQIDSQTDKQTDIQADKQIDKNIDRQIDGWTDRQIQRQVPDDTSHREIKFIIQRNNLSEYIRRAEVLGGHGLGNQHAPASQERRCIMSAGKMLQCARSAQMLYQVGLFNKKSYCSEF